MLFPWQMIRLWRMPWTRRRLSIVVITTRKPTTTQDILSTTHQLEDITTITIKGPSIMPRIARPIIVLHIAQCSNPNTIIIHRAVRQIPLPTIITPNRISPTFLTFLTTILKISVIYTTTKCNCENEEASPS